MSADFTVEYRGDYLLAQLHPGFEITPESMKRNWAALADACRQHQCHRVLAVGVVARREMSATSAFETSEGLAGAIPGLQLAACVTGFDPDEVTEFFKNVAHNRGAIVELFGTVEEAKAWLGVE